MEETQTRIGMRVFATSALLGTGLEEAFEFLSSELLLQTNGYDVTSKV